MSLTVSLQTSLLEVCIMSLGHWFKNAAVCTTATVSLQNHTCKNHYIRYITVNDDITLLNQLSKIGYRMQKSIPAGH